MTRWKTAKEWSSTQGTHQPHFFKSEEERRAQESRSECEASLLWSVKGLKSTKKTTKPPPQTLRCSRRKLPVVPQDDRHGRGRLASPVLVLLVLHLWLGPMPVLWASTSNSLMSYMLQPTGWSGHSSLPAILHTVQPRLIFKTEAKRVKGLKCEYVCVEGRGLCCQTTHIFRAHPSQLPFPPVGC